MRKKAQPKKLKKAQAGAVVKTFNKLLMDPGSIKDYLFGPTIGKKAKTTKKEGDSSAQMNANIQGRVPKNPTKTIKPISRKKGGQVSKSRAKGKRK